MRRSQPGSAAKLITKKQRQSAISVEGHETSSKDEGSDTTPPGTFLETSQEMAPPSESSPISQDQLVTNFNATYAELEKVEDECIDRVAMANVSSVKLLPDEWKALVALHRTLLDIQEDLLITTQHPSATSALLESIKKKRILARVWKDCMYPFLDLLRHRRPESEEYLLDFIRLLYRTAGEMYETFQTSRIFWIEALGDVARYQTAAQDDEGARAQWAAVAARWYKMAAHLHPTVGHWYHHLGILEPPSLRKLFFYAKSLTCVRLHRAAQDTLTKLCERSVKDEYDTTDDKRTLETLIVRLHLLLFSDPSGVETENTAADASNVFAEFSSIWLRDSGALLAVTNISSMLSLSHLDSKIRELYGSALNNTQPLDGNTDPSIDQAQASKASIGVRFCYSCFNSVLYQYEKRTTQRNTLAYVHTMLVWMHSLTMLSSPHVPTISPLLGPGIFSWSGLADYLNSLIQHEQDEQGCMTHLLHQACNGQFPSAPMSPNSSNAARDRTGRPDQRIDWPLAEDHLMRGLLWTQWYFPPEWFYGITGEDDDAIVEDTEDMQKQRVTRILWLGFSFTFRTSFLEYDPEVRRFDVKVPGLQTPLFGGVAEGMHRTDMAQDYAER